MQTKKIRRTYASRNTEAYRNLGKLRMIEDNEQLERHYDACIIPIRRLILHMKVKPVRNAVDRAIVRELQARKDTLEK